VGQLALGSIEGRSGSHDAELTAGQIIYTQQQKAVIILYKNKQKQKTVSDRHKEDVREASLAAVCSRQDSFPFNYKTESTQCVAI